MDNEIRTFNCKMVKDKYDFIISGLAKLKDEYQIESNSRMLELLIADALSGIEVPERD